MKSNYDNKMYSKLKIKDLMKITENRKKLIEEQKKEEKIKKDNLFKEQIKLYDMIIGTENNNNDISDSNKKLCEEGVQTSVNIKKDNNDENIISDNNKNLEKNNLNALNNDNGKKIININPMNEIIKSPRYTDTDLVNIGNETTDNIINVSSNRDTNDINKINNDLNFKIENNDTILSNIPKNEEEDTLSFEKTLKNTLNKEHNINTNKNKIIICENLSKDSSLKENENDITEVEEYNINKVNLQNETKSIILDNKTNSNKEKVDLKRYNTYLKSNGRWKYYYNYNKDHISSMNNAFKKDIIINNKKKNINISKSTNNINNDKNINTSQKYYHKKNVNSFGGYINKKNNKISINRKIINIKNMNKK